ncbi:zf-TFIIB domain-containing protein [Chloroflexota bacterium]
MKCPACDSLMIVVEHEKIELDYCLKCSGVWFDAGELELLLEATQLKGTSLSLDHILTSPEDESTEKKRNCPICGRKMKKAIVGHEPEVIVDACSLGDGLWFDSGEIGQLITQIPDKSSEQSESQGRIIAFLGEVFKVWH